MNSPILVLESDAYDNRANVPREWFDAMEALPEAESRRFLHCCHDEFEGRVFTSFGECNICKQFPVPYAWRGVSWPTIRGFDPGVTGAGWIWVSAVTGIEILRASRGWADLPDGMENGHLVVWWEYQPREVQIESQVAKVKGWDRGIPIQFTGIDPSDARQNTGRGLRTTGELLEDLGLTPVTKAPNDETAFILLANQDFASGRAWIQDCCQNLIRQLRDEVYDSNAKPGAAKRKYARQFHTLSAYKYARMLEPELLSGKQAERRQGKTGSKTGY